MKPILEFFVVFTVAILPQVVGLFFTKENKENINKFSNSYRLILGFVDRLGTILIVLYIASNQPAGLPSVGLSLRPIEIPKIIIVSILVIGYLSLIFLFSAFGSKKEQEEGKAKNQQTLEALGFATYKSVPEKIFSMIYLWTAVIAEELTYRGYLILLLGLRTGIFLPWIILSITLSVIVHLYQGSNWRNVYGHVFFAGVFIIALMITKNIIAAFIPHLVYDTVWLFKSWANAPKEEIKQLSQEEPVG